MPIKDLFSGHMCVILFPPSMFIYKVSGCFLTRGGFFSKPWANCKLTLVKVVLVGGFKLFSFGFNFFYSNKFLKFLCKFKSSIFIIESKESVITITTLI